MNYMVTAGNCRISVAHLSAEIRDERDSYLFGKKRDAAVCLGLGDTVDVGQYSLHIDPDEARRLAAMLIASADAADQSEAELAASLAVAA